MSASQGEPYYVPSTGIIYAIASYHSQPSPVVDIIFSQFYHGGNRGIYLRSHYWVVMRPAFPPGQLGLEVTLLSWGCSNCLICLSPTMKSGIFILILQWLCHCPYPSSLAGDLDQEPLLLVLVAPCFALFREHFVNLLLSVVGKELLYKADPPFTHNDRSQWPIRPCGNNDIQPLEKRQTWSWGNKQVLEVFLR